MDLCLGELTMSLQLFSRELRTRVVVAVVSCYSHVRMVFVRYVEVSPPFIASYVGCQTLLLKLTRFRS